jgi:hypothetical protein
MASLLSTLESTLLQSGVHDLFGANADAAIGLTRLVQSNNNMAGSFRWQEGDMKTRVLYLTHN